MKTFPVIVFLHLALSVRIAWMQVETILDSSEYDDLGLPTATERKPQIAGFLATDGSDLYPSFTMSNDGPSMGYQPIRPVPSNYASNPFLARAEQYRKAHGGSRPQPVPSQPQQQGYDPRDGTPYTRDIAVKQGILRGFVRVMHPQSGLKNVDQYLGIPYAEAPVGSRRFMPPSAPIPWNGLKMATKLSPVCPQNLPSLNNANNNYSKGRYDQIKRLLPYLKVESEDCLYLNLYVPSYDGIGPQTKYPVIVYIHGESYEWNSGNPYDGSILASYGQVIVVTLNFRLGILGFMKPGISDHTTSNFGLLDQIAALQWIKENIGAFGGDAKLVTVMGQGTGAACVNFLMVSPVAKGLFHRAILMSGSALSDWALTQHPLQSTMQVLQGLNCPLNGENDEVTACLRRKRYSEILGVKTASPQFSTRFGPIVDGLVIPNMPHKVMGQYSDIFSGYDLLYGMTELESYHILNAVALTYGLLENERDNLLRFYMQNRFEIRPDLALAATLREYTDIYMDPNKALADEHRDNLLEILSDARVAAPMVQTGLYLSKVNPKCYMYVFGHNSEAGEYGRLSQSVVGEDLAYVFGAPLGQVGPFQHHYNARERLFSEAVMKYFSNFAKTGNPKAPWKDLFLNLNPEDWSYYDVDWPEYNSINQSYLHMGITPVVGHRYRQKYMKFWNEELPEELKKITSTKAYAPYSDFFSPPGGSAGKGAGVTHVRTGGGTTPHPDFPTGHINLYPIHVDIERPTEDPFKELLYRMKDPLAGPGMYNAPATSSVAAIPSAAEKGTSPAQLAASGSDHHHQKHQKHQQYQQQSAGGGKDGSNEPEHDGSAAEMMKSESTLTLLIAIALVFLLFNVVVIVGYLVRRHLAKVGAPGASVGRKVKRKYDDAMLENAAAAVVAGATHGEKDTDGCNNQLHGLHPHHHHHHQHLHHGSYLLDDAATMALALRKSNSYEPVAKQPYGDDGPHGASVSIGVDAVDSHTKVCDWMVASAGCRIGPIVPPHKISVAIDATPQARSNSVLRQEPIEITKAKSFEYGATDEVDCALAGCGGSDATRGDGESSGPSASGSSGTSSGSCSSSAATDEVKATLAGGVGGAIYYNCPVRFTAEEQITSFIEQDGAGDVNVTSRDESTEKDPLTPEEALKVIQRRNFPKVLPDHPRHPGGGATIGASMKRRSLPPQSLYGALPHGTHSLRREGGAVPGCRLVPAPPPRICSTLGRPARTSNAFISSPPIVAEEPPVEEEPPIALNTLHVGPLLPTHQESTYMTMSRQNSVGSECEPCCGGEETEPGSDETPPVDIICIEHKPESHYSYVHPLGGLMRTPSSFKCPEAVRTSGDAGETMPEPGAPNGVPNGAPDGDAQPPVRDKFSSDSSATDTTSGSTGTIKKL
uniref:Carboxylesterase type B domain-containing protein n=1 Tax=Anopheles farauti TaxID=69004 RepID=A0A182QQP1_9DIPT